MVKTYKTDQKKQEIILNELNIRSVDRSRKDIATWRGALISAESVYFPTRTRLYDLYEDVVLDGHLSGVISKRIDAVLNKEISFLADGTRVHELDALLHSLSFRDVMRTIMETQLWGISGIEFIPGKEFAFRASTSGRTSASSPTSKQALTAYPTKAWRTYG